MKYVFLTLSLILATVLVQAQEVSEASRPFMKKEQANALSIVVQGQPQNVEAVLEKKIREGTGQKSKGRSGLRLVEGARYDELMATSMDLYYRVEKASKRDNAHSRVTLFLSTGNNNFITSDEFPDEMEAATGLLESLELEVKIYEMELLIVEQGKLIEKEGKRFDKMVQDSVRLQDQLAETKQAIEDNHNERVAQLQKIENEETRLDEFKLQLLELQEEEANGNSMNTLEAPAARLSKEEDIISDEDNTNDQN